MPVTLTADMRAIIESAHLCFAATVTPDGMPNVSPKGTIRIWDEHRLFFLDIASPGTRANLAAHPYMELNVVDQLSRRGYRFSGRAEIHQKDEIFDKAVAAVRGATYPVVSVILLEVERAAPLISPGYWHVADENEMRAAWQRQRSSLDREFEAHIAGQGAFRVEK